MKSIRYPSLTPEPSMFKMTGNSLEGDMFTLTFDCSCDIPHCASLRIEQPSVLTTEEFWRDLWSQLVLAEEIQEAYRLQREADNPMERELNDTFRAFVREQRGIYP